jgi:hypothetical protein
MAAGVPQVVSDWNGYRDTVRHGETGFLVPTRWMNCCDDLMHIGSIRGEAFAAFAVGQSVAVDMAEMEKYLHLLINNAQLRNEMSERSRNRALALFSFGVVAKQYDELWTELTRAANSIHAQPTPMNFARPAYHQFFGHYASKPLSEDTLIELSATANSDDGGVKCLPEYPGALANLQALDEDVFARIFELFKSCNAIEPPTVELHSPVRMGDLVETLRRSCSYHPDCLRRHIMWLIKFGFVNALGGKQRNERPRC